MARSRESNTLVECVSRQLCWGSSGFFYILLTLARGNIVLLFYEIQAPHDTQVL